MSAEAGRVYLVGAGPGDPALITLAAVEALAKADVVVYDRLANPQLLAYAPPEAERVFAGKGPDQHTMSQQEINALLVDRGRAGKRVVRLKGGDPFVFGRGGEEAEALAEAGLPFEVVPGVSSAIAAAAYAGIPITHRGLASSVAFVAFCCAIPRCCSALAYSTDMPIRLAISRNVNAVIAATGTR